MRKDRLPIKKPSVEFNHFLKAVNAIRGKSLPSYGDLQKHFKEKAQKLTELEITKQVLFMPEACKEYIAGNSSNFLDNVDVLINAYEQFRLDREVLEKVATKIENYILKQQKENKEFQPKDILNIDEEILIGISEHLVKVKLNQKGEFEFEVTGFSKFKDFDMRRFKTCPICRNIFWAERIDKRTCSQGCSNVVSQQEFRGKNKDAINERRRKNHARKVELKKMKEKNK